MILGQPGGGKSTLARHVGEITGLPVVHVDRIHWMPGWVERPQDDKIRLALDAQAQPQWVFEGGLNATKMDRLTKADMLIVLDMPFALRIWRVFWRTLRNYGRTRPDLAEDCPEHFNREFWKWIWDTRKSSRAANLIWAQRARAQGKRVVILTSPAMIKRFLKTLDGEVNSRH